MYQELLSSSKPGLIIIMIDQSGSMGEAYGNSTKANFAALAVNRVIAEIITACTAGDRIKDRCYVGVVGYGSGVKLLFLDTVSVLAENTNITTVKKLSDGAGGLVEADEVVRIFVDPISSNGTPMTEAFQLACQGVEKFISGHPYSFPPIVINITDGEPNNMNTAATEAKKIAQLKTTDGNVIIMNAHIAELSEGKVELPSSNSGFDSNKFANFLFDISTVLPETLAKRAKNVGFNVQPGSRGFVFNADAKTLVKLLNFGTIGGLR